MCGLPPGREGEAGPAVEDVHPDVRVANDEVGLQAVNPVDVEAQGAAGCTAEAAVRGWGWGGRGWGFDC